MQFTLLEIAPRFTCISCLPYSTFSATMQKPGSRRGSYSTVSPLEFHRSSTPENSQASSFSTLVEGTPSTSNVSPLSQVFSYASPEDNSSWPWWDAEAETIFRGPNLQAIQLLCRYHTYRDDITPGLILRKRWPSTLNRFLVDLSTETYSWDNAAELDVD